MHTKSSLSRPFLVPAFTPLKASIWAVLGLSAIGCGGNVMVDGTSSDGGGGSGGSGNGGETTTSTGTTLPPSVICDGAEPLPQANGEYSGYYQCPDGTIHRVDAVPCDTSVPACEGNEVSVSCLSDADCTALPGGKCAHYAYFDFGGETTACGCAYPCSTDNDCTDGAACVCAGVTTTDLTWSFCAAAGCRTGADCASGECGLSTYFDGCGYDISLACRADDDACRTVAECDFEYMQCVAAYGSEIWSCMGDNCAIGRPLIVEGRARTASRARRSDWADGSIAPGTESLSRETRSALAAHFREMAALEHASVASFARFSLELLALGAPPDLVARAHAAAQDEIVHARMAYALASAYSGLDEGPGPLDVRGVVPATNVIEIVTALVEEACVGETIGAAEATTLAGLATDPALADAYRRIAEDESRHAELGWSTLAWLLTSYEQSPRGADLRATAQAAFERSIARMGTSAHPASGVVAPEHGLLSAEMLLSLRRKALAEVVEPCSRALLGSESEPAITA